VNWIEEGHAFLRESGLADDIAKAHCELIRRHIDELEARAGIPRPCPKCGAVVKLYQHHRDTLDWYVVCTGCRYQTDSYKDWQDGWREHEANCKKAEEDEG